MIEAVKTRRLDASPMRLETNASIADLSATAEHPLL